MTFDGRSAGTDPEVWQADPRLGELDALRWARTGRTVVLAAHPDDETLGAGGLLAELAAVGNPAEVIVVSDGAASHPGSPTLTPADLARRRAEEVVRAVGILSPGSTVTLLGHPDGGLREAAEAITADLRAAFTAGTVPAQVVAPWRGDGHRDHRVLGEIAAALAGELGYALVEYPLWMWHWATPEDERVPWPRLRALPLADRSMVLKHRATAAHATQLRALSPAPQDAPALHPGFLRGLDRDVEVFVVPDAPAAQDLPGAFFDATYDRREDPWGFADRWYEARKRAVTLAALPDARYGSALEVGCSIGVLTAALAPRCDALTALDVSPAAVRRAGTRLAGSPHVTVAVGDVTGDVADGPFDLVVLSEVGYYLTRASLRQVLAKLCSVLAPGGTLLACHWRHPVQQYPLTGDDVHRILAAEVGLTRLVHHTEADLLLDVWSGDPRSVAARTGLT